MEGGGFHHQRGAGAEESGVRRRRQQTNRLHGYSGKLEIRNSKLEANSKFQIPRAKRAAFRIVGDQETRL
jgi:hypothetical protein